MGLVWNMSAAIATVALVIIGAMVMGKAKGKKDSPLYRIHQKYFKRSNREEEMNTDETKHYKRLSHRGGLKW